MDIANYLIGIITGYLSLPNSAFNCIGGILDEKEVDYNPMVKPPEYMKLGTIQRVDIEAKEIYIELKNMPVGNTGDGVFSNMKVARLLVLCYSLETLHFWCATHSTDLVLKRMATSKTMCVPQVVTTYDALRPVVKHFEKSAKSKDILDKSTSVLDLKQMKLISWVGTRMGHFMSACHTFTELLPVVHDILYSCGIKKEEGDSLFTVENIFVVVLLADLKPFFKDGLLRAIDKTFVVFGRLLQVH